MYAPYIVPSVNHSTQSRFDADALIVHARTASLELALANIIKQPTES